MNPVDCLVPSRHGNESALDEKAAFLKQRYLAARGCLDALPSDLPWKFLAEFAPMLRLPVLAELSAPPGDLPLLNELLAGLAHGPSNSQTFARYLAAAMFYCLPHELPITPPPSQLPLWIRIPYLKWSLALPQSPQETGAADRYARWLEGWLELLIVEFTQEGLAEDLPEYQRPRLRRLVAGQLELLLQNFPAGVLPPLVAAHARSIQSALQPSDPSPKQEAVAVGSDNTVRR